MRHFHSLKNEFALILTFEGDCRKHNPDRVLGTYDTYLDAANVLDEYAYFKKLQYIVHDKYMKTCKCDECLAGAKTKARIAIYWADQYFVNPDIAFNALPDGYRIKWSIVYRKDKRLIRAY